MIEKELKLDKEEVKKAIVHWVNEEIEEDGETNMEDIELKVRKSQTRTGGFTSLKFDKAVVKVSRDE